VGWDGKGWTDLQATQIETRKMRMRLARKP
jgi:hypothetical protein